MPEPKKYKTKNNTVVAIPHSVFNDSGIYSAGIHSDGYFEKGSSEKQGCVENVVVSTSEIIPRDTICVDPQKLSERTAESDDTEEKQVPSDGGNLIGGTPENVTGSAMNKRQKSACKIIGKRVHNTRKTNDLVKERKTWSISTEETGKSGEDIESADKWKQSKRKFSTHINVADNEVFAMKTKNYPGKQPNSVKKSDEGCPGLTSEPPSDFSMTDDSVCISTNNLISRRKLHKSYKKTWSTQLTNDGFAKCLIKTCNFISLDLPVMEDHYRICDGVQKSSSNLCSHCQCWLPSEADLDKHKLTCKGSSSKTGNFEITESIKRPSRKGLARQSEPCTDFPIIPNGDDEESPVKKVKYCEKCGRGFLVEADYLQHVPKCPKKLDKESEMKKKRDPNRWVSTMLKKWSKEEFNEECIIQPGRVLPKNEYVRRRAYTKQHKMAWEDSIKKYKFVKCIFQNCHFIGLSVQDMMSHFGYCNGDSSFATFVCSYCEGRVTSELYLKIHIRRSHFESQDNTMKMDRLDDEDDAGKSSVHDDAVESEDGEEHDDDTSAMIQPIVKLEVYENEDPKLLLPSKKSTDTGGEMGDRRADGVDENIEEDNGILKESQREGGNASVEEYKDDNLYHQPVYSKRKSKESSVGAEDSSFMVMKNNNSKHYTGPKNESRKDLADGDTSGNEDISSANMSCELDENSFNSSSHNDGGQFTRQTINFPYPSVETVKRRMLHSYTRLWMDSIDQNGFARCLVATCNFISLDLFHVQNHFKTCNGEPAKGPNLCNLCECRLPSAVEHSLHVPRCKANAELVDTVLQTHSENDNKDTEGCDANTENSVTQTISKDASSAASTEATGTTQSPKRVRTITHKTAALRIAHTMNLKENEMNPDLIIQQGPDLPKEQYVRRRAYTKQHKAVWESTLAKHKYLKCIFQNCHFLAMSLEDMIYHFGYCIGDGSFARFPCPYCGGRVTTQAILNLHIRISHSDETGREVTAGSEEPSRAASGSSVSLVTEQWDVGGETSEEDVAEDGVEDRGQDRVHVTEEIDLPSVEEMKKMFSPKELRTYGKKTCKNKLTNADSTRVESEAVQVDVTTARAREILDYGRKHSSGKRAVTEVCYNQDDRVYQEVDVSDTPVSDGVPECDGAEQTSSCGNDSGAVVGGRKGGNPAGESSSGEKTGFRRRRTEGSPTGNDDDEEMGPTKRVRTGIVSESDDVDESNADFALEETETTPVEARPGSLFHIISVPRKRGRPPKHSTSVKSPAPVDTRGVSESEDGVEIVAEAPAAESEMTPALSIRLESSSDLIPLPRKRGRPPKYSRPADYTVPQPTPDIPKTKGRRGRKPKNAEEEVVVSLNPSDNVKCAKCEFQSRRSQFATHNMRRHVGLSWIEGEGQPDLTDEEYVSWAVKQAFRVVRTATCENCNDTKKSALGFISHLQSCGKSEEEKKALKVTCPLCPRKVLKYCLPTHIRLSHSDSGTGEKRESDFEEGGDEGPAKRKSALRAVDKFHEALKDCGDDEDKTLYVHYEKGVSKFPKIPVKIRGLWSKMRRSRKTIPCRRGSCLVESSTVQEAKKHHFLCPELPDVSFVCQLCDYYSTTESNIQEHVALHPNKDGDFSIGSEEENACEEEEEMEVDEEAGEETTRTRTVPDASKDLEASHRMQFFVREGIVKSKMIRFCRRSLRMTLESETSEFAQKTLPDIDLKTKASDWLKLSADTLPRYLPSLNESISFHVDKYGKPNKPSWMKLRLFDAEIVKGYPIFFAGGSILSMSWSKVSYVRSCRESSRQYLAVSASRNMDKLRCVREASADTSGLIQIWDCGEMRTSKSGDEGVPTMVMGLAHDSGEVWELSWFPVDTYEAGHGEWATRLGLLGAACEDGTIRIWPICDPNELEMSATLPLYKTDPSVILELEGTPKEACLRLAIGRRGIVVGGYAHGVVAVWNLANLTSPFCKTVGRSKILKPHLSFQAHKRSITALSICPQDDRYITTSSLDRLTKFWDLECPTCPFETLQKEVCLDHVWPRQWAMTIFAFEDVVPSTGRGMMKGIRDALCERLPSPLAVDNTCWSLTYSEWFNAMAGCNNVGEVRVRLLRNLFLADERLRFRKGNILSVTELKFLKDTREPSESLPSEAGKGKVKGTEETRAVPRTYEEALQYFGLVITDYPVVDDLKRMITTRACKNKGFAPEEYPITSVNKVSWNPNYDSFAYLAMGHHSGLIRIRPATDAKSDDEVRRFFREAEYTVENMESKFMEGSEKQDAESNA